MLICKDRHPFVSLLCSLLSVLWQQRGYRASFSCTLEVGPEGKGLEKVLEKAQAFFSGAKASSENYTAKAPLLQGLLTHQ